MEYIPKIFILLFVAGLTYGCSGFLQKEDLETLTMDLYLQGEEEALALLTAAYSSLQYDGQLSPSGHFRWFWGDVVSDDAEKGGSGPNDVASLARLEQFEGRPTSELLASEWKANYDGVYFANVVLENVGPLDNIDPFLQERILGEAKFIRAYMYYNLVTIFGGVPRVAATLSPDQDLIPRASEEEIWELVEKDLSEAIEVLPLKSQYTLENLGRITKGAAQALLMKAYAWQEKWVEMLPLATDIEASGEYALMNDYESIFTLAGENGSESVFEIQFMNRSNGDWGRFEEGNLSNVYQRARGDFGGFGFNLPTQSLVDEYEEGDPRLAASIFRVGDVMGDRGVFTKEATGYPHDYYAKKYFINSSEEAPTGDPNVNGPSNDRVIRYADVLLLHAEAAYHSGDEGLARMKVNEVRERARGGNPDILPDVTANGPELLEAIYHERRVELALEGHRFFDLVRTGRAGEVMRAQGLNFVDGIHERFPIPLVEIQLSDGVIEQNPGY